MYDQSDHSVHAHESRDSTVPAAAILCVITILALALRLYRLDHESLWYDELTQTATYHLPLRYLVLEAAGHGQPPLDYLLGALMDRLGLAGSDWWVRLPAVLFGALSVFLTGLLVRRVAGATAGIGAALLLAVCPLHVVMSQEARPYTIFVCLALASLLAFEAARRRHTFLAWAGFACCALAMLMSRWVAPNFVMLGLAVHALIAWLMARRGTDLEARRRESSRVWAAATAISCSYAVYGPVFGIIVARAGGVVGAPTTPWFQRFVAQLAESYQSVTGGYSTATLFSAYPTPTWLLLAFAALALCGMPAVLSRLKRGSGEAAALVLLMVLPVAYAAVYAKLTHLPPKPQYLLIMAVPLVALVAIGADHVARRLSPGSRLGRAAGTIALLALLTVPTFGASWSALDRTDKRGWRDLMTYLRTHAEPGDAFAVAGADLVPSVFHPAVSGKHRYGLGWAKFLPIEIDTDPRALRTAAWRSRGNTTWVVGIKDRLYQGTDQLVTPSPRGDGWRVKDLHGLFVIGIFDTTPAAQRLVAGLEALAKPLPDGRGAVAAHVFRGRVLMADGQINRAHRAFSRAVRQCRHPHEVRILVEEFLPKPIESRLSVDEERVLASVATLCHLVPHTGRHRLGDPRHALRSPPSNRIPEPK